MKTKQTFEQFNKDLFKVNKQITWFDRKGIIKINDFKNATIVLSTNGCRDEYVGYDVTIIHKDNGTIDSHFFDFNDYLKHENRLDDRKDYTRKFYVWDKADWYIAQPSKKDINCMIKEIQKYIEFWK